MTRPEQEARERGFVEHLLRKELHLCGYTLCRGANPPDLVLEHEGCRTAIEVTDYHDPNPTPSGVSMREVEAGWEGLREEAYDELNRRPHLKSLKVNLVLRGTDLPSKAKRRALVKEACDLLDLHAHSVGGETVRIPVSEDGLLGRYVDTMEVRRIGHYEDWNSDPKVNWVGVTEQELLLFLCRSGKLSLHLGEKFDERWLLVCGGVHPSQIIAAMHSERLNRFTELNERLGRSIWDVVYLMEPDELFRWRRGQRWVQLRSIQDA